MVDDRRVLADRTWAICTGVAGIGGVLSYVALITLPTPDPVSALLATLFGFGFALASISLHLGVTGTVAPRLSLLAAVANAAAAVELLAMALVQIAVKSAAPHPGSAMIGIWLGLDVAWDVFGGAGTVLFGFALWQHPRFRPLMALSGILVGALLLAFNLATFPTPPAEAGWFDVGPLVALWYVVLSIRILLLAFATGQPAPRAAAGEDTPPVPATPG